MQSSKAASVILLETASHIKPKHCVTLFASNGSWDQARNGGHAVRYLIERDMMAPEELLGIENMIMGAQKITEERRKHAKYVIKAQEELRKTKADNAEAKLAYVAAAKSAKAFEKARLRAALAA